MVAISRIFFFLNKIKTISPKRKKAKTKYPNVNHNGSEILSKISSLGRNNNREQMYKTTPNYLPPPHAALPRRPCFIVMWIYLHSLVL